MKKNKFIYLYVVQGYNQTYGYEDLCQSESYKECRIDIKAYRDNAPGLYRIIKRRELNH